MAQATKAYGIAAITILIWSTVATAFKLALEGLNPIQLLLIAHVISTLALWIVVISQKKLKTLFQVDKSQLLFSSILGLLNPLCYYLLILEAYNLLPAQVAQPLNCSWAITLSLLSVPFLGQKLYFRDIMCLLVGYGGVVIIATGGSVESLAKINGLGVFFALASSLVWSFYWIANARSKIDPVKDLTISFSVSLPITCMVYYLYSTPIDFTQVKSIIFACYIGIFEMGISFLLWLLSLKTAPSTAKLNIMALGIPFLSLFWISLVLGERITTVTIIGLSCIVAAALTQGLSKR